MEKEMMNRRNCQYQSLYDYDDSQGEQEILESESYCEQFEGSELTQIIWDIDENKIEFANEDDLDDEKYRDWLIKSSMDFVKALAIKRKSRIRSAVELDDLIQAGYIGLIEAAKRYNLKIAKEKGVKFTSYAYYWIKKYMIEESNKYRNGIYVSDRMERLIGYRNKVYSNILQSKHSEPTFYEMTEFIAHDMHINVRKAENILKQIEIARSLVYSLDRKINEDSNTTFADVIEDPDRIEHVIDDLLPKVMQDVLDTLTPRETRVLEVRFGIGTGKAQTLEEVAKEFNVTRERIRQIEAKALRKLRHPSRSRKIKDFEC